MGLDSAGKSCAACVWKDGAVLALASSKMERGQDARLVPAAQEAMKMAGVSFAALDRIAAIRGPGSFTGIRICLAAARGFGMASGKPVIGVDRFSVYREIFKDIASPLLVAIDSKRSELFCRLYPAAGESGETMPPELMTSDAVEDLRRRRSGLMIAGDAAIADLRADTEEVVACCALAAAAMAGEAEFLPRPVYLRPPDVTISRKSPVHAALRDFRLEPITPSVDMAMSLAKLHAESFGNEAWSADSIKSSLSLPTTAGWLALAGNGEKAGFILCQTAANESEILTLCVSPRLRRLGIGRALVEKTLAAGAVAGVVATHLDVAADNHAARGLYEGLGFRLVRIRSGYYRRTNGDVDAVIYSFARG